MLALVACHGGGTSSSGKKRPLVGVTLLTQTGLQAQAYGVNGFGQFAHAWIEADNTINPSTNFPYVYPSATDRALWSRSTSDHLSPSASLRRRPSASATV